MINNDIQATLNFLHYYESFIYQILQKGIKVREREKVIQPFYVDGKK